jgi:hypothetical protein
MSKVSQYREITQERVEEFIQKGCPRRFFFPHTIYYIPKCGPDGYRLADRMSGVRDANRLWEVILYATHPVIDEFPEDLFFDNDLIWHEQQFGKAGQVATANLVLAGNTLYTMVHISDLVQRISRQRAYKTRIENRFKGWPYMLLNAIMNFALERHVTSIYSPTSDLAIANTDHSRSVKRELFEGVYDRAVSRHFRAIKRGQWWVVDVNDNADRAIIPERKQEPIESERTICLCHDIERGLGHLDTDPEFAQFANAASPRALDEILRIEDEMNVKATYHVLGCILQEVRIGIEMGGHCIAFHSYDHAIDGIPPGSGFYHTLKKMLLAFTPWKTWDRDAGQLAKCRQIDYKLKGYRPPRSQITAELGDANLCYHNFEWIASSVTSLGIRVPTMENRIVKIPVLFDEHDLFMRKMTYDEWEQKAIAIIQENDFVAFCLHDCYAHLWLPRYRRFLEQIKGLGKFKTLNGVAGEVILSNSV